MTISERKRLFNEMAIAMNTVDVVSVENFYYGFMKFVVSKTKERKELLLPDFGTFKLGAYRARMSKNPRTGVPLWVEGCFSMKFKADYKVNDYINDRLRVEGKIVNRVDGRVVKADNNI